MFEVIIEAADVANQMVMPEPLVYNQEQQHGPNDHLEIEIPGAPARAVRRGRGRPRLNRPVVVAAVPDRGNLGRRGARGNGGRRGARGNGGRRGARGRGVRNGVEEMDDEQDDHPLGPVFPNPIQEDPLLARRVRARLGGQQLPPGRGIGGNIPVRGVGNLDILNDEIIAPPVPDIPIENEEIGHNHQAVEAPLIPFNPVENVEMDHNHQAVGHYPLAEPRRRSFMEQAPANCSICMVHRADHYLDCCMHCFCEDCILKLQEQHFYRDHFGIERPLPSNVCPLCRRNFVNYHALTVPTIPVQIVALPVPMCPKCEIRNADHIIDCCAHRYCQVCIELMGTAQIIHDDIGDDMFVIPSNVCPLCLKRFVVSGLAIA